QLRAHASLRLLYFFFFFSSRRRHTRWPRDWSSDVCSSDLLRLMSPVKSVANYPTTMAGALAAADRVFEVLDLASEEGDRPGEVPARFEQRIEYRGVSFSYNGQDRKSTRLNSSHVAISYAVFCLKKKKD